MEKLNKYRWIIVATVVALIAIATVFVSRAHIEIPGVSPSEADLPPILTEEITGDIPMTEDEPREPCDLNYDGHCDDTDFQLFTNSLGKCLGDSGYSVLSDADMDRCVTSTDHQILFPDIPVCNRNGGSD